MAAETQLAPMMAQYRRIKGELPKDTQARSQLLNLARILKAWATVCR